MMVEFLEAIKKPFQDKENLAIGIVIGGIPIVNLLASGYALGVARKTINGDKSLPKWDPNNAMQYIKDAIFNLIIGIFYAIPGSLLLGIGAIFASGSLVTAIGALATGNMGLFASSMLAMIATGGVFGILGVIFLFIGAVFASMGIMFYVKENSLGSAFQIGAIMKKLMTGTYVTALIVALVYYFILATIAGILSVVPIIGWIIGLGLVTFAGGVTSATLFAETFRETP